jgi:hypothetical protein
MTLGLDQGSSPCRVGDPRAARATPLDLRRHAEGWPWIRQLRTCVLPASTFQKIRSSIPMWRIISEPDFGQDWQFPSGAAAPVGTVKVTAPANC